MNAALASNSPMLHSRTGFIHTRRVGRMLECSHGESHTRAASMNHYYNYDALKHYTTLFLLTTHNPPTSAIKTTIEFKTILEESYPINRLEYYIRQPHLYMASDVVRANSLSIAFSFNRGHW